MLQLEPAALRLLSAEDCGEAVVILEQFAFFLQRSMNQEEVCATRAAAVLSRLLPELLRSRREYMFEERKLMAVESSPECQRWECRRVNAELRLKTLQYLANRISRLADALRNLQTTKGAKL